MRTFGTRGIFHFTTVLLMAAIAVTLVSCSDSTISGDDFDAPLELTGVRYQSPDSSEAPDEIGPGDLVALEGQNMHAVARVYFNGVEASFNPALASKEHLVVTVPSDLPFGEMDPDDDTFNTIRVENESSEAELDFPVLPPAPQLQGMSNEYADPGEEVTITGQYLYLAEAITLPDGTTIPRDDITSEADGSAATFTIPSDASKTEGDIEMETASGSGVSTPAFAFHDSRGMICNFDDVDNWEYWSAMHPYDDGYDYETPASYFDGTGAEGVFTIITPDGDDIGSPNTSWWDPFRSINLAQGMEWVDPEHLDDPLENFAVKFELAIEGTWSTGTLLLRTENEDGWTYSARYEPWNAEDGVEPVAYEGWRTVVVPLDQFRTYDELDGTGNRPSSLSELLPDGVAPYPGIMLINDIEDAPPIPEDLTFAVDNIRVVRIAE